MLAALFPDLWNFFVLSATHNDTFVAGVDGAGYVYLPELGANARAYESRASNYMSRFNLGVVDVGIANIHYPASSLQQMQAYAARAPALRLSCPVSKFLQISRRFSAAANSTIAAFFNACGSAWGQKLVPAAPAICASTCARDGRST
jgi:hypothetical protein